MASFDLSKLKIFGLTFLGISAFVSITCVLVVYETGFFCLGKFVAEYRRTNSQIHELQENRGSNAGFCYDTAIGSISPIPPEPFALAMSVAFVTDVTTSSSAWRAAGCVVSCKLLNYHVRVSVISLRLKLFACGTCCVWFRVREFSPHTAYRRLVSRHGNCIICKNVSTPMEGIPSPKLAESSLRNAEGIYD